MQKQRVGIREAKIHLSRYIRLVKEGTEIILTDRGQPVVKMVPIENTELSISARIKIMEQKGQLDVDLGKMKKKLPEPLPIENNLALSFLEEDRNGK